ncbi:choice-of-anchor D domain-containing protein [Treponema sp. R80B11-R83G3]
MKKIFTLTVIIALAFIACDDTDVNSTAKLPSLTIKNESSFDLTDVKFSGISFSAPGSNDLPRTTQSVKQLTVNDVDKAGYITFVRKDIGIALRTEAVSVSDQDLTFTFLDTSVVEEVANSGNRKSLSQISFLSQVTVEYGSLRVAKNETLNFGETIINSTKQVDFVLKNTGVGKLLFTGGTEPVKINCTDAGVFSVVQPSGSEVAPNGSLTFKINFAPKALQTYTATVTISSNDQNGDFTFYINAVGAPPKPIATIIYNNNEIPQNGTINAGNTYITLSKNITVTIKNTGTQVLTIDTANITITGVDNAAFTVTDTPAPSISVGGQSQLLIEWKPVRQGGNNATLKIPTNDSSRELVEVYLQAQAETGAPVLQLTQGTTVITNNSLTPFSFSPVRVGNSTSLTFTIKNTGTIALELTGDPAVESSNAVFTITTQPVSKKLNPNETQDFVVQYRPTIEGTDNVEITINNNGNNTLFKLNARGTGTVPRPSAVILYETVEIQQDGTIDLSDILLTLSKTITVTVKNSGDANLALDTANITITGANAASFTRVTTPGSTIAGGAQTSFNIKCEPVKVGEHNAVLTIPTNDTSRNPVTVNLKANGVQGNPVLEMRQDTTVITNNSLTPFDCGRVLLSSSKSLTFTIKNTGNINLVLSGDPVITSSIGTFTVLAQPANTVILPGASAEFTIGYTPSSEGSDSGFLTILNNAGGAFTVNIKGTGYTKKPQITIKQGDTTIIPYNEFNFGTVTAGSTKEITFIVQNSGEANLTFVTVSGNRVNLDDNDAGYFSVTLQPIASTIVTPGNTTDFSIRFSPTATGVTSTATVIIKTNSENDEEFAFRIRGRGGYKIGDTGPGGGIIFYAIGSEFKECTKTDLGSTRYTWAAAKNMAENYQGNGFTDWRLPDITELNSMYQNLHRNSPALGGFNTTYSYWSSTVYGSGSYYDLLFYSGNQNWDYSSSTSYVRAVRSFTF